MPDHKSNGNKSDIVRAEKQIAWLSSELFVLLLLVSSLSPLELRSKVSH